MDNLGLAKTFACNADIVGVPETATTMATCAIAHALIAIAERLDRIIETQVELVPIVGTVSGDGKVTMMEREP